MPYANPEDRRVNARRYYGANLTKRRGQSQEQGQKIKERNMQHVVDFLIDNPCAECGEEDFRCLEFHHERDDKELGGVGYGVSNRWSIEKLQAEMDKCIVLCANCHKKTTANLRGWYSYVSFA